MQQLWYWALQGKVGRHSSRFILQPSAWKEEGDLCKRHIRWTPFREKHLKVFSLPTMKNMGLEARRDRGCPLTIPLSAQEGSRTWAVLQQIWSFWIWCNLGQSLGLNFPEWVSSYKDLSFLGSCSEAARGTPKRRRSFWGVCLWTLNDTRTGLWKCLDPHQCCAHRLFS